MAFCCIFNLHFPVTGNDEHPLLCFFGKHISASVSFGLF